MTAAAPAPAVDYAALDDDAILALAAAGDPVAKALVAETVNVLAAYAERLVAQAAAADQAAA